MLHILARSRQRRLRLNLLQHLLRININIFAPRTGPLLRRVQHTALHLLGEVQHRARHLHAVAQQNAHELPRRCLGARLTIQGNHQRLERQAIARCVRQGQTSDVSVFSFVVADSEEEVLWNDTHAPPV